MSDGAHGAERSENDGDLDIQEENSSQVPVADDEKRKSCGPSSRSRIGLEPPPPEHAPRVSFGPRTRSAPRSFHTRDRGYSLRRILLAGGTIPGSQTRGETINHAATGGAKNVVASEKGGEDIIARAKSASSEGILTKDARPDHHLFRRTSKLLNDFYNRARKTILRIPEVRHSADGRHILINQANLLDERTHSPYIRNSIRSSRYSLMSFFPRQLFAQFSKLANAYFLVISIMQVIPGLSTTGQFTTIVPLMVFIGISMAKEGWDDIRRWKLDKEENNRSAFVLKPSGSSRERTSLIEEPPTPDSQSWISTKWSDVKVGDILRLSRNDQIPADMILMYADGGAFVETMALDGETNLKKKQPPAPSLSDDWKTLEDVLHCQGEIVVEDPSMDLYHFEGKISFAEKSFPLTTNEVLYRGSVLRNTPVALGIVCYTGEECRIRQNANKNPRIKAPALQTLVNKIVILIAGFVLALSLGCSFGYSGWDSHEDRAWYLRRAGVNWGHVLTSFIIMFNTLLPLSLYVSMEIVKLIQIALMNWDVDMFDEVSNTPMQCQTSTINEELGQVSYVFSDKTGTLTKNEMKVKKLSCGGYTWYHESVKDDSTVGNTVAETTRTNMDKAQARRRSEQVKPAPRVSMASNVTGPRTSGLDDRSGGSSPGMPSRVRDEAQPQLFEESTLRMIEYVYQNPVGVFANKARRLILSLALCHTCIPERMGSSDEIHFQATSPDELALVIAAQEMGYLFVNRENSSVTVKILREAGGSEAIFETYEILHVIEFTSSRKRMSVIVREPDGRLCIHCKGADSVIVSLLRLSGLAATQIQKIEERMNERKSLEAQDALKRRSSAVTAGRVSFGGVGGRRRSGVGPLNDAMRRSVDRWLSNEDAEVSWSPASVGSTPASPFSRRTSVQFASSSSPTRARASLPGAKEVATASPHSPEVKDLVNDSLVSNEPWVMEQTLNHINEFANQGLRTLLHAARYLDEEEYQSWAERFREATTSFSKREERISEVAELIENRFELVGATAIEDKLQQGVEDTIDRLRRANIKLWMLTGDKRETAMSISRSCQLAKDYSVFIILDHAVGGVEERMRNAVTDMSQGSVAHGVLVVDGETLASIQGNSVEKKVFLDLAMMVDSVICCRASPSQKAMLVKSIRHRTHGAVTLAIGDGANDVAMIQEADVGIGISGGKEGLQAARTSDYAIAQFRFLGKLLLVHGRYNYDRISKYILGTTYKEMVFYLTQALYQRSVGYTGTSLYESWSLSWYNTLFTSLPIIFLGAFMADLLPVTLLAVPELYSKGQRKEGFNFKIWLWWTFLATVEAMLVFFTMYGIYGQTSFTLDNGLFAMGVMTYSACVIIVNVKLQVLEIHNKTVLAAGALVLSIGCWFVWNVMLSAVYKSNSVYNVRDGILDRFGRNALWWLTLIVIVLAFMLFELAIKALKAAFFPSDVDLFQVLEQDRIIRQRFDDAASPFLQHVETVQMNGDKKPSDPDDTRSALDDAEREAHVEAILQRRASPDEPPLRASEGDERRNSCGKPKAEHPIRKSLDVFGRGFGSVKKGHLR